MLSAQSWPSRPIRIVVPFPPGSAADAIPRAVAQHLSGALGVACVIDNRPGAGGMIGAEFVARAEPDGHTLLSHTSAITIQPHMTAVRFEVLRDFEPVAQTISGSYVLVTRADFPASDLRGWIAHVRARPGAYNYSSHGSGSGPHLAMELLKSMTGLYIVHVPFRGAAPALQELLAGRIDMGFDTTFAALPHLRAGRLKAIALGGARTLPSLPAVARVADVLPGFDTDGWQGLFAPAATGAPIVARLAAEVGKALREPQVAGPIEALGFTVATGTPAQFADLIRRDYDKWARVVRERRIKADTP